MLQSLPPWQGVTDTLISLYGLETPGEIISEMGHKGGQKTHWIEGGLMVRRTTSVDY